jgi:hypothetical protein
LCGRAVCNSCVVFDGAGAARCTTCAAPSSAGGRSVVPWERRAELGTMNAFLQTVKGALVRPGEMLAPTAAPGTLGAPYVFALVCQSLGAFFAALWQVATMVVTTGGDLGWGEVPVLALLWTLAGPLLAANTMFLWGGIVHLGLLILSAGRGGFVATARVQAYTSASALLNVVPIFGGFIAAVWGIVAQVIGLGAAHETSPGRTLGAVLGPILLCCLLGVAFFALSLTMFRGW